jgi:hypothetical protein
MRPAVSRASSGSVVSSPNADWPGAARSMPVPSESISANRSALLDDEMPTTATIAAMPMAMPSAVRLVRSRRLRSPIVPARSTSIGRIRLPPTERAEPTGGAMAVMRRPPCRR